MRLFSEDEKVYLSVKENHFKHRFSKKEFKFNSQIEKNRKEDSWVSVPFLFYNKSFNPSFDIILENSLDKPSVNSFWEIKSEHVKSDNCEIKSKSTIRLKNVVSGQFLSFGSEINYFQKSKLIKNYSKETTDAINEELQKSDKITLKKEIDRLGKLMISIKNKKESPYLEKEDLVVFSLLKKKKYKLGIFEKKEKPIECKSHSRQFSQSFNNTQSNIQPNLKKEIFSISKINSHKNNFDVKFSEYYSSKESFFRIKECKLLDKTEQLVSSSLEAVLQFYSFAQIYGFKENAENDSYYFDLDSLKKSESEFKSKSRNFLKTISSLEKFLQENMSKEKQRIFIDNYVIESLLYLLQLLTNKTIDCVADILHTENRDNEMGIISKLLQKEIKTEGLFDPNLMYQISKPEKVLNSLSEEEKEKWNRQRFNIPRFIFNKFKIIFEAVLKFLSLIIFENTFYCIYLSKKLSIFLKLLYFFPDHISRILKEISLKIGQISFFDSRIEKTKQLSSNFIFDKLIKNEGFLYREGLFSFCSEFFELSNKFMNTRINTKLESLCQNNQFNFLQKYLLIKVIKKLIFIKINLNNCKLN